MLARLFLTLAVVAALLVASANGQAVTTCASPNLPSCITLEMTTPTMDFISLTFTYDSRGDICQIQTGSIQQPASGNNPGFTATITPGVPRSVGTAAARVVVRNSVATSIIIGFTATLDTDLAATPTQYTGSMGSATNNILVGGTQSQAPFLVFGGFTSEPTTLGGPGAAINEQINDANVSPSNDHCTSTSTSGDPHFSGFHGQQFEVFGYPAAVLNILSDSIIQLNARLVELADGDCMTYSQMKLVRLASGDAIPMTKWFDHAGSYMGEMGLAMQGGHRVYAKAGGFQTGFESVTMDGEEMAMGAAQVIGQGRDAIVVTRVNSHQISIRTPYVRLTVVNSDKFFNVEPVHLGSAYNAKTHPLGGALGQTADENFTVVQGSAEWQAKVEEAAVVVSNDLFDMQAAKSQ